MSEDYIKKVKSVLTPEQRKWLDEYVELTKGAHLEPTADTNTRRAIFCRLLQTVTSRQESDLSAATGEFPAERALSMVCNRVCPDNLGELGIL